MTIRAPLLFLLELALWLVSGCSATPPAPMADPLTLRFAEPLVPSPLCFAANADLRQYETAWLAKTRPGHLTLLCRVDVVDGTLFVVADDGHYETLWNLSNYLARVTRRDVDFVDYGLPLTCAYRL